MTENWLIKVSAPDRPDQVWVADITYLGAAEGWLYLADVLDACTRRLVDWQVGETLEATLVIQAWQKAVRARCPGPGLLHRSDRGSQYASGAMTVRLREQGVAASMNRRDNCYGNALMESFWPPLKAECFHGKQPPTRQAAKLQIFDNVEGFYNRSHLYSSLGYQFLLAFETNLSCSRNNPHRKPQRPCPRFRGKITALARLDNHLAGRRHDGRMQVAASSLPSSSSSTVPGTTALFFIQIFATLGFAVLYSTLVLYATKHLGLGTKEATTLMGVFGAFNYGLHLFGGYLGGRFLSNRNLFVGGMVLQVGGCAAIAGGTAALFYVGLALFLTGSGLNVTCINMMLTQRFTPDDPRREGAFLWNYAGMNVGFFVGFTAAGYFQASERYTALFLFATLGNFVAIVLAAFNWRTLADRHTPLLETTPSQFRLRQLAGLGILVGLVPVVWFLLQRPGGTETLIKAICAAVALALVWLTVRHPDRRERRNMTAYLILTVGSLMFWSLYQMAPNGLQLFAINNVRLFIGSVEVQPQWVQNINTVCIVVGGPLLAALFTRLRARGWPVDIPQQFAASLLLMALAFLILPLGIHLAGADGKSAFVWLFASYVLQSIGELLISPIGYAMIGKIAPRQYQGVMMGSWMLVTGLASLFAGDFSGMIPEPTGTKAAATNPGYAQLFAELGAGSLVVGLALVVLIPFLRKLITDKAELAPVAEPVPVPPRTAPTPR